MVYFDIQFLKGESIMVRGIVAADMAAGAGS